VPRHRSCAGAYLYGINRAKDTVLEDSEADTVVPRVENSEGSDTVWDDPISEGDLMQEVVYVHDPWFW
jgi:hypothetical protein